MQLKECKYLPIRFVVKFELYLSSEIFKRWSLVPMLTVVICERFYTAKLFNSGNTRIFCALRWFT